MRLNWGLNSLKMYKSLLYLHGHICNANLVDIYYYYILCLHKVGHVLLSLCWIKTIIVLSHTQRFDMPLNRVLL